MPTGSSLTRNPLAMRRRSRSMRWSAAIATTAWIPRGNSRLGYVDCRQAMRSCSTGLIRTCAVGRCLARLSNGARRALTLAFAKAAWSHGARLANYMEATGFLEVRPPVCWRHGPGQLTGTQFGIRARVIVNAAGPWAAQMLSGAGVETRWPLLKAMNLVTSRPARKAALVAPTRAGRALVMLPWQGRTLVGTSESPDGRQPDDQQVRADELAAFLSEVNDTFPALGLKADEITLVHRGIVPAMPAANGRLSLLAHSRVVDHGGQDAVPEVLTIVGVKYTTARAVAERAVDLIFKKLQRAAVRCRTSEVVLPGAGLQDREPADPIEAAVRAEMAHTLVDVVVRRTGLGAAGYPGDAVAGDAARRMQSLLGWTDVRMSDECDALRKFYALGK